MNTSHENIPVLIVEDDTLNVELMKMMIEDKGTEEFEFEFAKTVEEAYARLRSDLRFVISDQNLGDMNGRTGIDVVKKAREIGVPAIINSADINLQEYAPDDIEVISKTLDPSELISIIRKKLKEVSKKPLPKTARLDRMARPLSNLYERNQYPRSA